MKRKLISAALCATMVGSLLAGSAMTAFADEAADNGDIKIGVSIWSSTDVLGSQCKKILDEAAKALGVEVQYVDQGHVSEQVTASVDQLIAAGCQGIIICNSSDTEMMSAINSANNNGVYLAQFFRIISEDANPDIYELAKASDYYAGAVHENEPENGEKLVQILLDKGCRNIGLIGWEQGDATWLGRWEGYKAGVDKWNAEHPDDQAKLSDPQYAGTTSEGGAKAADALMSADPDLDALIPAGGGGDLLRRPARRIPSRSFPQTSFRTSARDLQTAPWPVNPADITAIRCSHSCWFTTQSRATTVTSAAHSTISTSRICSFLLRKTMQLMRNTSLISFLTQMKNWLKCPT